MFNPIGPPNRTPPPRPPTRATQSRITWLRCGPSWHASIFQSGLMPRRSG